MSILSISKKIFGVFLVFLLAFAFSACKARVDNSWIIKSEGVNFPDGIYKYYLRESYKKAEELLQDDVSDLESGAAESPKPLSEREIEGLRFNDWVRKETVESCKDLLAIEHIFKEENLSLTEQERNEITKTLNDLWTALSGTFEKFSISKEDVRRACVEFDVKYKKVFNYYYARDGKKKVTDDEILDYYKNNYVNYSTFTKYAFVSSKTEENEDRGVTKEQIDDARNQVVEYVKAINSGEKSFSDVVNSFKERENLESDVVQTETINLKEADVSEEILDKLRKLEIGKADYVEIGDSFIVLFKNDISGNLPDLTNEEAREGILVNMKYDEFKEMLNSVTGKLSFEENTEYMKTFVPSDIFKDE